MYPHLLDQLDLHGLTQRHRHTKVVALDRRTQLLLCLGPLGLALLVTTTCLFQARLEGTLVPRGYSLGSRCGAITEGIVCSGQRMVCGLG